LCGRLNLSKLRVPWDIDTRWNSTYKMLHRVNPYKYVISETLRNLPEGLPLLCSTEEWDQLEQLRTFLKVFFNATIQLSCSYTPSAHQLFQDLYLISKIFFFSSLYLFHYKCQVILLQIYFYFFQGVSWIEGYRTSSNHGGCARWLSSVTDYRTHERENFKILGRSLSCYNSCQLSLSFIQEEIHHKIAWTV
jgi:hypothetical protein